MSEMRAITVNAGCLHCVIGETIVAMKSMGLLKDPIETIAKLLQCTAEVIEQAPPEIRASLQKGAHMALTDHCKMVRAQLDGMDAAGDPEGRHH